MRINKNTILFGILIFGLIFNFLSLFNIQYYFLGTTFSFVFLVIIPGLLIMLIFKIGGIGFWEYLVYTIGLSIAFLMFGGLFINWILPLMGIARPLSSIPLLVSFDIFLLIFWIIAYKRNKEILIKIDAPKLSGLNIVFFTMPIIFLVLSIFGATALNNYGSNILTMVMLGGIAVYILLVVFFRNKINENVYPWAIIIISLAMLLATILRSWNISGHDVITEYKMFLLTKENFLWSMSNAPGDPYYACLSITILPTVLSSFLNINDEYIFKILFQIIFSFTSIGVFLFLKRYTKNVLAFLAVLFFISFPTFFIDLPMMARQEISLFSFTLIALILFNKQINQTIKNIAAVIFGFSMIVSHYSTSYIALALFLLTYILTFLFRRLQYKKIKLIKLKFVKKPEYYLSGFLVLIFFIFSFLWYALLTNTATDLSSFMSKSFKNLGNIFSEDIRAERTSLLDQFNIFFRQKDQTSLLHNYIKESEQKYKDTLSINYYPQEKYEGYTPKIIPIETVPEKINSNILSKIYFFREILNKLMKVFIIIGVFYLIFKQIKKSKIDIEYIFITLSGLLWLLAMMILPLVTIEYNLLRVYQQVLIVLALPSIIGIQIIFKFLKKESIKIVLISFLFVFYFLFTTEFIPQIIGGTEASIQLNNYGLYYDRYYTHDSEVKSAKWLSNNYNGINLIYVDESSGSKLKTFSGIKKGHFVNDILPSIIDRNAYVYLGYTNTIKKINIKSYSGEMIEYDFPEQFLNDNKNKIYNNGGSEIFK